jgi:hypothetical protein
MIDRDKLIELRTAINLFMRDDGDFETFKKHVSELLATMTPTPNFYDDIDTTKGGYGHTD